MKITSVVHKGFYNALTSDATLFVDGALASSMAAVGKGHEHFNFGLFQVNSNTLASNVWAPLAQLGCNTVGSFYCTTQIEDGSGGSLNALMAVGLRVLTLP